MELQGLKQKFDIIGDDPKLNNALDVAVQVANTDLPVLIVGESGAGKEVIPQIIHRYSARKHNAYIPVNCGAIPEGTVDSELFGHEKGAFTGAIETRKGYFEVADQGTIFLDEVAELPLPTQARLLRVLQSGEFYKVGSSKIQKTNVRVVAATNRNLPHLIRTGKFREDLYYRLNTIPVAIPALRERKGDIYLLFRKFAADFAERYHFPPVRLNHAAQVALQNYRWPGNVRQLKSITEQISILEKEREIDAPTLLKYLPQESEERLPVLSGGAATQQTDYLQDRELLYNILLKQKQDLDHLKDEFSKLKAQLQGEHPAVVATHIAAPVEHPAEIEGGALHEIHRAEPSQSGHTIIIDKHAEDPAQEEYTEYSAVENAPLSIPSLSKELIKKCLEKHNGKRKQAAQELGISERTLYRKIKSYSLD